MMARYEFGPGVLMQHSEGCEVVKAHGVVKDFAVVEVDPAQRVAMIVAGRAGQLAELGVAIAAAARTRGPVIVTEAVMHEVNEHKAMSQTVKGDALEQKRVRIKALEEFADKWSGQASHVPDHLSGGSEVALAREVIAVVELNGGTPAQARAAVASVTGGNVAMGYPPHQGARERARRARRMQKAGES